MLFRSPPLWRWDRNLTRVFGSIRGLGSGVVLLDLIAVGSVRRRVWMRILGTGVVVLEIGVGEFV